VSSTPAETAPAAATEGEAPAPRGRFGRRELLAAGLLAVAVATHFIGLEDRPLHHDESIHAYQSYTLARDGTWRYDPAYHGPFLYYANALVYKVAGASNFTARLLPAVFGLVLLAFAIPLARWIGRTGAVFYALLVVISPSLTYFSRFIREDMYSLVFTLATIVAFRLFLETDRFRWLVASAVSFALAGTTKENAYMTGVLFVAFAAWALVERVALTRERRGVARETLRAAWQWTRTRIFPLFAAGLIFLTIWTMMYTAFGRHPGDWLAIPKAVRYWMGQHAIARIPGPPYYYVPLLLYYETAAVAAAILAFRRKRERFTPFIRFVVFWAVGSLLLYAWAREKVPWLMIHSLLPIVILGAVALAGLWRDRREKGARLALAAVALLAVVNATGMYLACFRYAAHDKERRPGHAEMLAYVQTSWELIRSLRPLDVARRRGTGGQPVVTVSGDAAWPLTWYFRETPTRWASRLEDASTPMIVVDWEADSTLEKQLAERYEARRVPIRSWWFPEIIRRNPAPDAKGPTAGQVIRWWLFHEIWSPIGSQDATVFIRRDLEGSGPLPAFTLPVKHASARDYPGDAAVIEQTASWGGPGNDAGELSEPRGLATDARGNLYVADTKNNRVQVFDREGNPLRTFGRAGEGAGELKEPCGLSVDPEGDVWVADTWNHRVARFGADGGHKANFGDPDRSLFGPRAVVFARGFLYVADTGNKRILRFDREGKKVSEWGGDGDAPGEFIEPVGLAADASGNIYVADTGNHRVQVFDGEGKFLRQFAVSGWKDFYTEPHLAVGPSDTVYVTDSSFGRVAQYDKTGALLRSWRADGVFKQPTGIAVDPYGRLIVSDRGTNRLYAWPLTAVAP